MPDCLDRRIWNAHQSWYLESHHEVAGRGPLPVRVRVLVRRNAYDEQSEANVYRWTNDEGWSRFCGLPITTTPAADVSYTDKDRERVGKLLLATETELLTQAATILRGTR